jgi:hypothetical protein
MSIPGRSVAAAAVAAALLVLASVQPASSIPPELDKDVNVVNTPNVVVANVPTVTVGNTPTVNIGNSPVVTLGGPLQLAPVVPFTTQAIASFGSGNTLAQTGNIAVPPGKRFVVEHVSLEAGVPTGQQAFAALSVNGNLFMVVLSHQLSAAGFDVLTASQPMKLYVDSGSTFHGFVNRSSSIGGDGSNEIFTLSGYLVDLP